jgi:hypothetical protein
VSRGSRGSRGSKKNAEVTTADSMLMRYSNLLKKVMSNE